MVLEGLGIKVDQVLVARLRDVNVGLGDGARLGMADSAGRLSLSGISIETLLILGRDKV